MTLEKKLYYGTSLSFVIILISVEVRFSRICILVKVYNQFVNLKTLWKRKFIKIVFKVMHMLCFGYCVPEQLLCLLHLLPGAAETEIGVWTAKESSWADSNPAWARRERIGRKKESCPQGNRHIHPVKLLNDFSYERKCFKSAILIIYAKSWSCIWKFNVIKDF